MSRYRPGAGLHAIEQAVVGIRLFGSADDATFNSAVAKAAELASEYRLPGRVQLDPMALMFGKQVISFGYAMNAPLQPGVMFQRVAPDGSMAEELTIERNAVTYRTQSYRRWADVAALINGILCPVGELLAKGASESVSVVELRCIDRFVSEVGDTPPLSELVSLNSPYISRNIVEKTELLHIHSGWFQDVSADGTARTLTNLNVDVTQNEFGQRSAAILQVISRQGAEPAAIIESGADFSASIANMFEIMHGGDKILLRGLLTPEIQDQINLFPREEIEQ
ncbi:TIGR04255 family protein [Sphingomonas sp. MMS24-J13]|uniref:TIGR04255 family protein n=1 Tax=Sphingomonas sp. MMS24-J13 TaxID=3238686 RepID=UPI00384F3954